MKLIIDIDEELARKIENLSPYLCDELLKRIANGIPLPKGHGDIIDVKDIEKIRIADSAGIKIYHVGIDTELYVYAHALVRADKGD